MKAEDQLAALRGEVVKLFEYIQRIRTELASIQPPGTEGSPFARISDQLAGIVETTEQATQNIMAAVEDAYNGVKVLAEDNANPGAKFYYDLIDKDLNVIIENCAFQDITGQRIGKVVKTMNLLEGTINSLIVLVGADKAEPMALPFQAVDRIDQGVALAGPQRQGQGISQAEIDKLFD